MESFLVTGQSKDSSPSDISCLKEGRECHSALKRVEEMWDKPLEKLEKVDNPTETDETENEKNELELSPILELRPPSDIEIFIKPGL